MKKLNTAIIGLGTMSDRHAEAILRCEEMNLAAICSRSQENLDRRAEQWGVKKTYQDFDSLLKDEEIDAVIIATPNYLHADMTVKALNAGKHVFCEKPPATTATDAKRMMECSAETGKLLMYGLMFRFSQKHRIVSELREAGMFGEIYYAKAGIIRRCGSPGGWFADKSKSGGGPLMDLGPHIIDLAVYLMGNPEPVSVFARTFTKTENLDNIKAHGGYKSIEQNVRASDVEELAVVMVNFNNGACLHVETSFCSHINDDSMYLNLLGSQGGAEVEPQLVISTARQGYLMDMTPRITGADFDYQQAINDEIQHFADCVLTGADCAVNAKTGYKLMKIIDCAYRSAESGELVGVPI